MQVSPFRALTHLASTALLLYKLRPAAMQSPTADVQATVGISDDSRGSVTPSQLTWTPATWQKSQIVTLAVTDYIWQTVEAGEFYITLLLQSTDSNFDGRRPRVRVRSIFIH